MADEPPPEVVARQLVDWKQNPTEHEAAQIARWRDVYGEGPYELVAEREHPEIGHLEIVATNKSGAQPLLPRSFFHGFCEPEPTELAPPAEEPAAEAEAAIDPALALEEPLQAEADPSAGTALAEPPAAPALPPMPPGVSRVTLPTSPALDDMIEVEAAPFEQGGRGAVVFGAEGSPLEIDPGETVVFRGERLEAGSEAVVWREVRSSP